MKIFHRWAKEPKNNKSWEIQIETLKLDKNCDLEFTIGWNWGSPRIYIELLSLFKFHFEWNRKSDHAGIRFYLFILGLDIDYSYHDIRHWNYDEDRWETQEEIDAEIEKYQQTLNTNKNESNN